MGSVDLPLVGLVAFGGLAASSGVFGMVIANRFLARPRPLRYRFGVAVVVVSTLLGATVVTATGAGHAILPVHDRLVGWLVSLSLELLVEVAGGIVLSPILLWWLEWLEPPAVLREIDSPDAGPRE